MMPKLAALLVLSALPSQEVAWKKSWAEALKEAKASNKLAVLIFFQKGRRDCDRFEKEALASADVKSALSKCVCAMVDPEGTDDDNKLWQTHKMPPLPTTYVYDPEGKLLTSITALLPKYYAPALEAAGPAYFFKIVPAREALAKDPNNPDKLGMLGEAYYMLDNQVESPKYYEKAVDGLAQKGDKAGALKLLGSQLEKYHDGGKRWYPVSRAAAQKVLELDPSNSSGVAPYAVWMLALADSEARKWNDIISSVGPAIDKYKSDPLVFKLKMTVAFAYMQVKDNGAAVKLFEDVALNGKDEKDVDLAKAMIEKLKK